MAQISPPFRILLVAVAVLGAVWFVALRPKPEVGTDAPLPPAPGVTGLTSAAGKADAAVKGASASVGRTEAAAQAASEGAGATTDKTAVKVTKTAEATEVTKVTRAPGATTVTKAVKPAKPAAAKNPAAPLLAALERGQVVVLLFRNTSSDSAAVAAMVRSAGERRKVVARVASIKDVGRYETFTSGTPITQAPTTVIIGPRRNAEVIVGFTSVGEIAQGIADVRRAGRKAA